MVRKCTRRIGIFKCIIHEAEPSDKRSGHNLRLHRNHRDDIIAVMATLKKVSVSQVAIALDQPFSMANLARVGDIVVSVYICRGTLAWHRHVDNDELFWAFEGTILLESEWGALALRPGELAVVPKGVSHRSSARLRASVLLLRCGFAPDRKNGRRRLYSTAGNDKLKRVSLWAALRKLASPFWFETVAQIEDSVMQVARGEGTWTVELPVPHDLMLFVLDGTAVVRTSQSLLHLHPGDLTAVPQGAVCQLSTTKGTTLVQVTRQVVH